MATLMPLDNLHLSIRTGCLTRWPTCLDRKKRPKIYCRTHYSRPTPSCRPFRATARSTLGFIESVLTWHLKKKNQPHQSVELRRELAGEDVASDAEEPLESVLRSERSHQLHQALNSLDDEQRSVLVLRELEGCNYDEISSILDLPPGTVRSRLHRGRKALRELLQHKMDDSITPSILAEVQKDQ